MTVKKNKRNEKQNASNPNLQQGPRGYSYYYFGRCWVDRVLAVDSRGGIDWLGVDSKAGEPTTGDGSHTTVDSPHKISRPAHGATRQSCGLFLFRPLENVPDARYFLGSVARPPPSLSSRPRFARLRLSSPPFSPSLSAPPEIFFPLLCHTVVVIYTGCQASPAFPRRHRHQFIHSPRPPAPVPAVRTRGDPCSSWHQRAREGGGSAPRGREIGEQTRGLVPFESTHARNARRP